MTDHDPDKSMGCFIYLGGMALGLAIFGLGVYIGALIS